MALKALEGGSINAYTVFGYIHETERKVLQYGVPTVLIGLIFSFYDEYDDEDECFGKAGKTITVSGDNNRTISRRFYFFDDFLHAYVHGTQWINCGLNQTARWRFVCNMSSRMQFGVFIKDTKRNTVAILMTENGDPSDKYPTRLTAYDTGDMVEMVFNTETGTVSSTRNSDKFGNSVETQIGEIDYLEVADRSHLQCKLVVRLKRAFSLNMMQFTRTFNSKC